MRDGNRRADTWESVSRAVAELYVRRANESLLRHFASPEGTCDWCTTMWRHPTPYPCLPAQIALAINDNFRTAAPRTARATVDHQGSW